ncbi:MAG: hypothetical protein J5822_09700 [Eubacteriaceae bacterium]|nr:hypothetical protein [Eubacteriaceae bacterium]
MFGTLIKLQLTEMFKSFVYDEKKKKMRSAAGVIAMLFFFVLLLGGVLGGMFAAMSLSLCGPLTGMGFGWLYFLTMSIMAVVFGAFGSVFTTYQQLYLSKDNDLLLSMPIPVRTLLGARLFNVYLMGTMYVAVVMLPALIVYWITQKASSLQVVCGIMLFIVLSLIVLLLSCLLGWVVAKISLKLKNRSYITVLISLAFIAAYYYFYFRASEIISQFLANAQAYGEKIKGSAYALYLIGRSGEGDVKAVLTVFAVTALVSGLLWYVMSRSFISIATSTGSVKKVRYVEKTARQKSPFAALMGKEFARFASSAAYMLNCGLGIIILPLSGILMLFKGRDILMILDVVYMDLPGFSAVLVTSMLCMLGSMNDMAVPSVSLEGKSIWIPQSLPVSPGTVIASKAAVQIILTGVPMLFASVCCVSVLRANLALRVLVVCMSMACTVFSALFGIFLGLKMPSLSWTNEITPIKKSVSVLISIFTSWFISIALAGGYLLAGGMMGAASYLAAWTALMAVSSLIFLRWLGRKGSRIFSEL